MKILPNHTKVVIVPPHGMKGAHADFAVETITEYSYRVFDGDISRVNSWGKYQEQFGQYNCYTHLYIDTTTYYTMYFREQDLVEL